MRVGGQGFRRCPRFEASNALIDELTAVRTEDGADDGLLRVSVLLPGGDEIPLAIEPSWLLFGVDREAYKQALTACREARLAEASDPEIA
jgi:hypothetical protein